MIGEKMSVNPDRWYRNLVDIAGLPPRPRYDRLVKLHTLTIIDYISHLTSLTEESALEIGSDGRTRAIVVAHIMGWEEYQIQVFGDPDKQKRKKEQLQLKRFYDEDNNEYLDFANVDEFNQYQARRYANWKWDDIRKKAIMTARKLQSFFPEDPTEEWLSFLDQKPKRFWKLTEEYTLDIPAGWYLWMVSLEHEAVEHRADLEM